MYKQINVWKFFDKQTNLIQILVAYVFVLRKSHRKTIHRYLQYKNVHVRAAVYIYYALEVGTTCLSG